ncbi:MULTISPECIES: efflux RND transporter periplasmic adaptor subunit [Enterococcus]|uniref:HlyD family secretion protein n=1 Tax=Candidatus Enterococcus mangumiae TaxID=2230878 RepID=A0ABZ2SXI7_9ENTE|nr:MULTISPECIES: efflux RND transporter periplasmic adaptor subunit [unclassified Enterococcus]MBO0490355.1 efflux RND transporter periplasmic adaptor subunit [Enterococcus sp. DIV1094]MBO1300370.1 efflux RND transporter periplasmic adaptor subunit [Enterococcus sp. DIV1271a]
MKQKKRTKFNRKWYLPIAVIVVLLGIGAISLVATSGGTKENSSATTIEARSVKSLIDEVKSGNLILAGKVMPNNSNKIKIDPERGSVKEILVNEGDVIEKGQPLFTYQTDQQTKVAEAEMDVEIKVRAVEQARATASQKWTAHNQKVAELGKARQDYAKEKSEELQSTIKALEGEVTGLHAEAIAGDNEVKNAETELRRAQLLLENEKGRLNEDTVTADHSGRIKSLNRDLVNQSKERQKEENFMEILDDSNLYVDGQVTEFDREKVAVDQRVEIMDRKNQENTWQGSIVQVANLTNEAKQDDQKEENPNLSKFPYKVKIDPKEEMPLIGSNVYVNVLPKDFVAGKVIINQRYLMEKDEKYYVWKVENDRIKEHEVKVNLMEDELAEIVEGLTVEDQLALPQTGMVEGMEVGASVDA